MTLEDTTTIDLVAATKTGQLELVIVDPGTEPSEAIRQDLLRRKLEAYAEMVVSPDFSAQHPGVRPADVTIRVVHRAPYAEGFRAPAQVTPPGMAEPRIAVSYEMFEPDAVGAKAAPGQAPAAPAKSLFWKFKAGLLIFGLLTRICG